MQPIAHAPEARDQTIRRLNDMLARRAGDRADEPTAQPDDAATVDRLIRDLNRRLSREIAWRQRGDQRLCELAAKERAHESERKTHEAALQELAAIKRLCRQTGKSYDPLRTASLSCLLAAPARMSATRVRIAAE
jgi:chromosome segregation ATPase